MKIKVLSVEDKHDMLILLKSLLKKGLINELEYKKIYNRITEKR